MSPDERARLKKQMADQAVKLAISSRWDEAVNLNREYLRKFGDDADGHNRLGKALTEIGRVSEAREAYGRALEIDPTNTIARRNLDRLSSMKDAAVASAPPTQLDTRLFIEETGQATVATLQAVDSEKSAQLDAGDLLELRVQGNAVNVHNTKDEYIGMVEPRIGLRLAKMMAGGNRYTAALVTSTGELKVIIRETFQHPSQIGKVSFPQSRTTDIRAYTRRGLLRQPGEEFEYGEDEEVEEEEAEEGWSEAGEELDHNADIDIEAEDESFD
jgi:tetratricopeptide (TPR) repeat protein